MTRLRRATIVLPLVVVLLGAIVPVLMTRDDGPTARDSEDVEKRIAGRAAGEWEALAARALDSGRYRRAISYIKTAEKVRPGTQYETELRGIRAAMRRASVMRELHGRFLEGPADQVVFGAGGEVLSAHRTTIALPGESLWTLARDLAAARLRVLPERLTDADVYVEWSRLTDLNGVRELEVGENVLVPLAGSEVAALEQANARDLARVGAAAEALAAGDLDGAVRRREALEASFAGSTAVCRSLDADLAAALEERAARLEFERENDLMDDVRATLARVPEMPRSTSHTERLDELASARAALLEAEELRPGDQYADAAELIERLVSEETRFDIRGDGTVIVAKPSGVSYTDAARQAVEWVLERGLRSSGYSYPYSARKTNDERAWALYLAAAQHAADERGSDFVSLLEAVGEDVEIALPNPVAFFAD